MLVQLIRTAWSGWRDDSTLGTAVAVGAVVATGVWVYLSTAER